MAYNDAQFSLDIWWSFTLWQERVEKRDIIVDRKSKYTVVAYKINSLEEVKEKFKELRQETYFRKATHNTYAYRLKQDNGSVIEGKNDDGEAWAWLCVLRELQRENALWVMLIVTRYFGWIQLHGDRFRNVVDACKLFFETQK